jgi:hypothetical protein
MGLGGEFIKKHVVKVLTVHTEGKVNNKQRVAFFFIKAVGG